MATAYKYMFMFLWLEELGLGLSSSLPCRIVVEIGRNIKVFTWRIVALALAFTFTLAIKFCCLAVLSCKKAMSSLGIRAHVNVGGVSVSLLPSLSPAFIDVVFTLVGFVDVDVDVCVNGCIDLM